MAHSRDVLLVTGSSGFIGTAAVGRFAARYRVVALDRDAPARAPADAECIPVDLGSDESVQAALGRVRNAYGERIASVIHSAAYYDFAGEPSPLYEQITVRGTERLLRELRGFSVGQFVFASTVLVHAPCRPGERIDEDWPLEPKWDYPASKVRTEELLRSRHGDVPLVILRLAGVYDDRCHSIPIAQQIQRIYERRLTSRVFPGDTATGQSFVHLDDLMTALERVVDRRASLPSPTTLLIGEPDPISYEEAQRLLGRLIHDEDWETTQIPKALAKTGAWVQDSIPGIEEPFIKPWMVDLADDHFALDVSRARTLLDWQPRRTLRDTLAAMVAFLKRDPDGFYRLNKLAGAPPPAAEPMVAAPGLR